MGTLWPIRSQIGKMFTDNLYNSLAQEINEPPIDEPGFWRVLSVREVIIAVKKDPYSWAYFVLHGSSFYRIEQSQRALLPNKQRLKAHDFSN